MKLIVKVLFSAVKALINLVLLPIDTIVHALMPDLSGAISQINSFFSYITDAILWVKSWLPFATSFWTILTAVLVFRYTVPLAVHGIKTVVAWYDTLKP